MTELRLRATSQADDAGFLALQDIAAVADGAGLEYRVVGGQMGRLHVALAGVPEPAARVTLDADLGVTAASARNPALVSHLVGLGYSRTGLSNRFCRETHAGPRRVIDVLAPAYGRRLLSNQTQGDLVLDAIPGLPLALATPGEQVALDITLRDGTGLSFVILIPDLRSALCLKALGWASRRSAKDAVDVWRLLRAQRQRHPEPMVATGRLSGRRGRSPARRVRQSGRRRSSRRFHRPSGASRDPGSDARRPTKPVSKEFLAMSEPRQDGIVPVRSEEAVAATYNPFAAWRVRSFAVGHRCA